MKLSTSTLGCFKWDLSTLLARLRDYGFDGVDFRGLQTNLKLWLTPEFSAGLKETAARLRDSGLAVSSLSSGICLTHTAPEKVAEADEELARTAEICAALDCRLIRVFGGNLSLFAPDATEADRERAIDHVAGRCRETAARAGSIAPVALLVETHDDWTHSEHLAQVLARVGRDDVGCCWDIRHPWWIAGEVPETTWRRLKPWVRNTHWKDARRIRGSGGNGDATRRDFYVPMGEGIVPARDAYDLLRGDGYDGWFTLEWEKHWAPKIAEPEVAFPAFVRFMRDAEQRWNSAIA
jgi:sugar phosphate isomerase/epimerase